jgi:glycine hydroxymethyltransferase
MGEGEMKRLAAWMNEVVAKTDDEALLARVAEEVREMCSGFPPPGIAVR